MNLSAGYPFWLIQDGIPYNYPKLLRSLSTQVVVLGGGISGALMSFYLQQAGIETVVLDGRTIGLGSTCASTSLLQYEIDTPLSELQLQIGHAAANRAYALCADSISELAAITQTIGFTGFAYKKSIYYAALKKHLPFLKRELEARKQMGIQAEWLDCQVMKQQYGISAPAAILSEPAAQTNAYALTHALHQYNIGKGTEVYDRTFITRVDRHKKGVSLFTENGYRVNCKKLICATGYETVRDIDKKFVRLSSTYVVASEQFHTNERFLDENILLWSTANPYLYVRSTDDKRILVGGRDEGFVSSSKRDILINLKSHRLVKDFQKLVPGISFKKEFSWTGTFGSTKDGLPFIGSYAGFPNSFFALGFGGNGITFSVIAARMLSGVLTGKIDKDLSLFSFDRV